MNIYDFFNSPDVAEHCRSIGHTLNAVESAVMIDQCYSRTLAEKHAAYRTIIAEYPDIEIPRSYNHEYIKSFHKVLGEIISYEEVIQERLLLTEPDAIYRVIIDDDNQGICFSNYEKSFDYAMDFVKNDISIHKGYMNCEKYVTAKISQSGEIMRVQQEGVIPRDQEDELDLLNSCYIDVPVPFRKGDLVEVDEYGHSFSCPYGSVYVLKDICRNNTERNAKSLLRSDLIDMTAEVYYEMDGSVECEVIHFYPDLRYCKRELEGKKRILKYVSLYMQDKLCLCSLLKIQKYLLLDEEKIKLKESYNLQYDLSQFGDNLLDK